MEQVLEDKHSHAIYPGSSASNLSTLISSNLGWGAKFRILLDSDKTGLEQKEIYMKSLALVEDDFVFLPDTNKKLEKMFSDTEKSALHELAFGQANDDVSKNEFLAVMRELHADRHNKATPIAAILTKETKERFQAVLRALKA